MMTAAQTTVANTVLIAEDKDVVRIGLRQMVESVADFTVVGDVVSGQELMDKVRETNPRVVLLKDSLDGADSVELCQQLKKNFPDVGVVLMVNSPDDFWMALHAKADAYFFREVPNSILEPCLRAVANGGAYIGTFLAEYLLRGEGYSTLRLAAQRKTSCAAIDGLSNRERQVLGLLSEGNSNEQIAKILGLSIQTVKVHVKHILKKLSVSDRTQAVIKALRNGY